MSEERPLPRRLAVGAEVTRDIPSRPHWVPTSIHVQPGEEYALTARGCWHDASIESEPCGYDSPNLAFRLVERWRRVPNARWFELVGTIDRRAPFRIGNGRTLEVSRSGELVCFANDLWIAYGNNRGAVTLSVRRLR